MVKSADLEMAYDLKIAADFISVLFVKGFKNFLD